MKDSVELARLCSLDIGREVDPEHVRSYLLIGEPALQGRYTPIEQSEIIATLYKELSYE